MKNHAPHATHTGNGGIYRSLCSTSNATHTGLVDATQPATCKRCVAMLDKADESIVREVAAYRVRLLAAGRYDLLAK